MVKANGCINGIWEDLSYREIFWQLIKKETALIQDIFSVEVVPILSQVCPKSLPCDLAVKILERATIEEISLTELMEGASQTERTKVS